MVCNGLFAQCDIIADSLKISYSPLARKALRQAAAMAPSALTQEDINNQNAPLSDDAPELAKEHETRPLHEYVIRPAPITIERSSIFLNAFFPQLHIAVSSNNGTTRNSKRITNLTPTGFSLAPSSRSTSANPLSHCTRSSSATTRPSCAPTFTAKAQRPTRTA